jgi:hypothetical protein
MKNLTCYTVKNITVMFSFQREKFPTIERTERRNRNSIKFIDFLLKYLIPADSFRYEQETSSRLVMLPDTTVLIIRYF